MSELGELLELIHDAALRSSSIRAVLRERQRPALLRAAVERWSDLQRAAGGMTQIVLGRSGAGPEPELAETAIRLWSVPPGRSRVEHYHPGGELRHVVVIDGERWWSFAAGFGLHSSDEIPGQVHGGGLELIDPAQYAAGFVLEPAGRAEVAGRRALRARARRRPWVGYIGGDESPAIDDVELVVDAERGVLLRRAAFVDGEEASVLEVTEIAFDEPIPDERFRLDVPPEEQARAQGARPLFTTLDAAVALASFAVWKIDPVPSGWRVQAVYAAGGAHPMLSESVTLLYSRPDGAEHLQIHQSAAPLEAAVGGERVERGGREYLVLGPDEPEGREPAQLLFSLYGTEVRMSSSELSRERLLELAAALTEA